MCKEKSHLKSLEMASKQQIKYLFKKIYSNFNNSQFLWSSKSRHTPIFPLQFDKTETPFQTSVARNTALRIQATQA